MREPLHILKMQSMKQSIVSLERNANLPSKVSLFEAAPQVRQAFQGIKPHTTKDDYVLSAYKDAQQAIHDADKHQPNVVPQVPSDDYMIEHVKSLSSVAGATPSKRTRWPFSAGRKGSGSGLAAVSAR